MINIPGVASFPGSNLIKVDTLIAGYNYNNAAGNTGLSICVKPLQQTLNTTFNDFVVDISQTTNLPLNPPLGVGPGGLQLALTLSYSTTATLSTLVITVVFHTIIPREFYPNIFTGYAVTTLQQPAITQIINTLTNKISVVDPQKIFGTSCLQFPDNSPGGINIKMNVPQAQTQWVNSTTGFSRVDTGDYMYTNRYPCAAPINRTTITTVACTSAAGCTLTGQNIQLSAVIPPPPAAPLPAVATVSFGAAASALSYFVMVFNMSVPNPTPSIEQLTVSGGGLTNIYYKSSNGIPVSPAIPRTYYHVFTRTNAADTVTFSLAAAFQSGTNLANVLITNIQVYEIPSILVISAANALSCAPLPAPPATLPLYIDPSQLLISTPMVPLVNRACTPTATGDSCNCPSGFYVPNIPGASCLRCQQPYCLSCNLNPAQCDACDFGRTLVAGGSCGCSAGTVATPLGPCVTCNSQCATCDTSLSCLTCLTVTAAVGGTPTNRVSAPIQGQCPCTDNFYDAGTAVCSACPIACRTCAPIAGALGCTSCKLNSNTVLNGNACVCQSGFTQSNPFDGTCYKCDVTCLTCQGPSQSDCLSCPPTRDRYSTSAGSGACYCRAGYTEQNPRAADCVVASCAAVTPGCVNCNSAGCLNCSTTLNRQALAVNGVCLCANGFFNNTSTNTCDACGVACITCTSSTSCTTCYTNSTTGSGVCSCPVGTYPVAATSTCTPCSTPGCSVCAANTCTACSNPWIYVNNNCSCPDGTYPSNGQCVPCSTGCRFCNSTSCITCNNGQYLLNGACVSSCPSGFVIFNGLCAACPSNCLNCAQPTTCTGCNPGFYLYSGLCVPFCPTAAYANTTSMTCTPCSPPCASCSFSATNCSSCSTGNLLANGCVPQCPTGTTSVNGACLACSPSCATCFSAVNICSSCTVPLFLYNGTCVNICPSGTFYNGRECQIACADGFYALGQNCASCSPSCTTCQGSATFCSRCPPGQFLLSGGCIPQCPPNTIPFVGATGGQCLTCLPNCAVCSSPTICQTCISSSYQLLGGRCIQCVGSTALNPVTGACDPCPLNCIQCLNSTFCTQCATSTVLAGGVCYTCMSPCATCNGNPTSCASCQAGYALSGNSCNLGCPIPGQVIVNGNCQCQNGFLNNGACAPSCPTGTGPDPNKVCVNCSINCDLCAGSALVCSQCRLGFVLSNGTCVRGSGCPEGQALVGNVCTRMCGSGRFFIDNFCVDVCPVGFAPNADYSGCVPQANTTVPCQIGQVFAFGQCYSICPAGTFTVGNLCVSCPSNCMTCVNGSYCVDCAAGYYFSAGTCLLASICSPPQLSLQQNCVSSCPEGTYPTASTCERLCGEGQVYYSGLCYASCSAPFVSNGFGCIANCPAGQIAINGTCTGNTNTCGSGSYFNNTLRQCLPCQFPCATCIGTATICTSCLVGTLSNGQCQNNGNSNSVIATVSRTTTIGNQAEIVININFVPPGLTIAQQSQFFLVTVVPNQSPTQVFQWYSVAESSIRVLLVFPSAPSPATLILGSLNVAALAQSYLSAGYNNFQQGSFQVSLSNAIQGSTPFNPPATVSATLARSAPNQQLK